MFNFQKQKAKNRLVIKLGVKIFEHVRDKTQILKYKNLLHLYIFKVHRCIKHKIKYIVFENLRINLIGFDLFFYSIYHYNNPMGFLFGVFLKVMFSLNYDKNIIV